jgi:Tfp pilus assembly protein PilN
MFTVDLLKGKNVPARTQPQTIAVGAIIAAVPVIAAIVMIYSFFLMGTEAAVAQQRINWFDSRIARLSGPAAERKRILRETADVEAIQQEAASCLPDFIQWFDVVNDIVAAMPDSMVLNKLQVTKVSKKKSVPKEDNSGTVETTVNVPVMHLSLAGSVGSNYDLVVKDFRDKLLAALSLKDRLENIRVATEQDSYELFLDFKVK